MKKLKLEDYELVQPYLKKADYEGYNSNFVTMMMWDHEYHIQYEIHEHFLIMLHKYKDIQFWSMPFTTEEYYQEAIDYMMAYSHQHQFPFMIDCAVESFIKKVRSLYHDRFIYERTPDNDDYIYDKDMLKTLSGKKMQKRRNHYNAFIKEHPDYVYRDLDMTEDFDTILNCLNKWEGEKGSLSESMTSEVRGIMALLSSKNLIDFRMGGIFIHKQMEAFIIASRLNHSTIQIHVEKANKEIRGLYPAILKEFLEHHFLEEKYVNREEDMGLENLRQAKQALHPIKMIYKYCLYENHTTFQKAEDSDLKKIMHLWQVCFQDETPQSTQFYFQELYQKEHTYTLKHQNRILSVLQIVPMMISKQGKIEKSNFILGVCTDPCFRNQGFMKRLLGEVLKKYQGYPLYLQAYVPDIYRPFGFYASHYHQLIKINMENLQLSSDMEIVDDVSLMEIYYNEYTKNFDEYRIRNQDYWKMLLKRCHSFQDQILIFKDKGYCIYHEDENEIFVSEAIYLYEQGLRDMLAYFCSFQKTVLLECDLRVQIDGECQHIITMMSNQITQDEYNEHRYINEIY